MALLTLHWEALTPKTRAILQRTPFGGPVVELAVKRGDSASPATEPGDRLSIP